jgi:hypothetical protein
MVATACPDAQVRGIKSNTAVQPGDKGSECLRAARLAMNMVEAI